MQYFCLWRLMKHRLYMIACVFQNVNISFDLHIYIHIGNKTCKNEKEKIHLLNTSDNVF